MKSLKRTILGIPCALALLLLFQNFSQLQAFTLKDLQDDPNLTPETFARRFAGFKYKLLENVQPIDVFLSTRTGDCDDFATLAADVLKAKGYTPKLVVVFMQREIHVVCYVEEIKSYLDFNLRNKTKVTVPSDGTLADIAEKVAASFSATWHCASEFTFKNGVRRFVFTDFRQETIPTAPAANPVLAVPSVGAKN